MNQSLTHVLVVVDPQDDSLATQLAAARLSSAAGALLTLLHIDARDAGLKATSQLDALDNLHAVLHAVPDQISVAPAYPVRANREATKRLRTMRDRLVSLCPDELEISIICRSGDAASEITAFIEEAGVDVVFVSCPAACRGAALRRLAKNLQKNCPCQLQVVHPPHVNRVPSESIPRQWWNAVFGRWQLSRRIFSPAPGGLSRSDVPSHRG